MTGSCLSGGGALVPYLPEYLQSKLNIPLELANPLRNIDYDPELFQYLQPEKIAPLLAVSVGLAMRKVRQRTMIEINLLPKDYLKRQGSFPFGKAGLYVLGRAVGVVVMLIVVTFYQMSQLKTLESDISKRK